MTPEAPSDPPLLRVDLPTGPVTYTDVGQGPVVIALHGLPGSVRDYRWLGAALGSRVRLLRVDQAGFGGTPLETWPGAGLPRRADLIRAFIDALGLERVVVMGHSMGGGVAAAVAARHREVVSGLALLASIGIRRHQSLRNAEFPPVLVSLALRVPPLRRALLPRVRKAFDRGGFKGHPDEALLQTLHSVAWTSFALHEKHLRSLRIPTLVAWTKDDPLVEEAISEQLYWACPSGPRIAFADGGHNLQKSRAVELADALAAWVPTLR